RCPALEKLEHVRLIPPPPALRRGRHGLPKLVGSDRRRADPPPRPPAIGAQREPGERTATDQGDDPRRLASPAPSQLGGRQASIGRSAGVHGSHLLSSDALQRNSRLL